MKKKLYYMFLLLILSQISFGQLQLVQKVGHNTPAFVETKNDTLFVCNDALLVYKVKPEKCDSIGQVDLSNGYLQEIVYENNKVYAAHNENGIIIYDISNISNILTLDTIFEEYNFTHLHILNNHFFAIASKNKVNLMALIDLNTLAIKDTFELTNDSLESKNVLIDSANVYITYGSRNANSTSVLKIISHNHFNSYVEIKNLQLGNCDFSQGRHKSPILSMAKKETLLYVAGFFSQPKCDIQIIDVSKQEIINTWGDGRLKAFDIELIDDVVYLTNIKSELLTFELENDTILNLLGTVRVPMPAYYEHDFYLNISGNTAFLNNWDNYAVFAIDISNPGSLQNKYSLEYGHDWRDITISEENNEVYAAVWNCYQLYTIDISQPNTAYVKSRKELLGSGWGVACSGNLIFSAMGDSTVSTIQTGGTYICQRTDTMPIKKSWIPPRYGNHDVKINIDSVNKIAYILCGQSTAYTEEWEGHFSANPCIRLINYSELTDTIAVIDSIQLPFQGRSIHRTGENIYIAATDTTLIKDTAHCGIIKINAITHSIEATWYPPDNANRKMYAAFSTGQFVYTGYGNSLILLDTNLTNTLSSFQLDDICMDIVVENKYIIALTRKSLYILEYSENNLITGIDSISNDYNSEFRHLAVSKDNIYVQTSNSINIFNKPYTIPQSISNTHLKKSVSVFPNPTSSLINIEISEQIFKDVVIKIFDMNGRKRYSTKRKLKGNVIQIDIGDLENGIYLMQIVGGDLIYSEKIIKN